MSHAYLRSSLNLRLWVALLRAALRTFAMQSACEMLNPMAYPQWQPGLAGVRQVDRAENFGDPVAVHQRQCQLVDL